MSAFSDLKKLVDTEEPDRAEEFSFELSGKFVIASLLLMAKMPNQSKTEFRQELPFSDLEISLLDNGEWSRHATSQLKVTKRLNDWVRLGSLHIDERAVHCSSFLITLTPYLDLWDERTLAESLARNLSPD